MTYLLDTNVCIALINRRSDAIRARLEEKTFLGEEILLSAIVLHELWYGIGKSQRPETNRIALAEFLSVNSEPLTFTKQDAEFAGKIRAKLRIAGIPIGPYDVLIAGQALARGLTLVTANTREFSRVAGLSLVDWTAS